MFRLAALFVSVAFAFGTHLRLKRRIDGGDTHQIHS
jgi:hypothetical protein